MAIGKKMRYIRVAATPAVPPVIGHEEVETHLLVQWSDAIVIAGYLTIPMEEED